MTRMPEASIDAIVTDPPYELGFMGKSWDARGIANDPKMWAEALRVLKPGGHLLAFGGTRTYHRMTCAIEDAGFEIRDCLAWLYGSGFPKSLDVSKAMDRAAGAEREIVGRAKGAGSSNTESLGVFEREYDATLPSSDLAKQWQGWGTALKPAHEPIVVARKPLIGTVAKNVETYGTGALNVDGCRIAGMKPVVSPIQSDKRNHPILHTKSASGTGEMTNVGRWPANVLLSHSWGCDPPLCNPDCAVRLLDEQSGTLHSQDPATRRSGSKAVGVTKMGTGASIEYADTGGASRFFYTAKASRRERGADNTHPTVKPIRLMRWLVKLVTPPGGIVLDPFAGSGTTGLAAEAEGFRCVLIEREAEYVEIIRNRMEAVHV